MPLNLCDFFAEEKNLVNFSSDLINTERARVFFIKKIHVKQFSFEEKMVIIQFSYILYENCFYTSFVRIEFYENA